MACKGERSMQAQGCDRPALAPSKRHKIGDKRKMQRQSARAKEEEDDVMERYSTAKHTYTEPPKTKL